jgi:hypothetical protein
MSNLLRKYIKSYISESKLTPGTSSDPGSYNKYGGGFKGKNNQTPGMAGGHGHVELFKTKIYCPDDGYWYQAVEVDGPTSDTATGETVVYCKINDKFSKYFPESMHDTKIISMAGSEGEMEVLLKAQNLCAKIIRNINSKLGNTIPEDNVYTFNPSAGNEPSSF